MNVFFRQVRFTHKPLLNRKDVVEISDDPELNKPGRLFFERRNGIQLAAGPRYSGELWKPDVKQTRRAFFSERFVKRPEFARAHVNFLWAQLFGSGLTEGAFDDMDARNTVLQEKIMDRLAAEFVKSGHDSKALLRWICTSDAYGLKSVANQTNAGPDGAIYFARQQARPLSRAQLVESLIVALTTDDYAKRCATLRAEFMKEFQPAMLPALSHCEVEPFNPEGDLSIRRALWMLNGKAFNRELSDPKGTVAKAIEEGGGASFKTIEPMMKTLYPISLCRPPTQKEFATCKAPAMYSFRPGSKTLPDTERFWKHYAEDIFWATLNSNEFALNH
jgi:hypothetical protein